MECFARRGIALALCQCLGLMVILGCGSKGPKTYPVVGSVQMKDGDMAILTGSAVELKHESDEYLRPMGNIDSSGKFTVKTLLKGEILLGAPEGKYQARIILGDPSDEGVPKRKGDPIHRRFFDFQTSGLAVTVPSSDYTISVSKK